MHRHCTQPIIKAADGHNASKAIGVEQCKQEIPKVIAVFLYRLIQDGRGLPAKEHEDIGRVSQPSQEPIAADDAGVKMQTTATTTKSMRSFCARFVTQVVSG